MSEAREESQPEPVQTSESEVQRVERLFNELESNPAIRCVFSFTWNADEAAANKAAVLFRLHAQVQRENYPWMDFGDLTEVRFHHDYEQGLKDAVGIEGAAPVPTQEVGGLSIGMLVRVADAAKLVMHESVAHAMLSDQPEHNNFATHVVRHELCHVHDNRFKLALARRDGISHARNHFESRFLKMSEALWAEYFANKYSHGSWSDCSSEFELLRNAVISTKEDVRRAIVQYRTSSRLDELLEVAEEKGRFLTQCIGYAAGRLAGMKLQLEEADGELVSVLREHKLRDVWDSAVAKLGELDGRRPGWSSYWDILELNSVGDAVMRVFGLHYRAEGEDVRVDVPFTPDTVPSSPLAGVFELNSKLQKDLARLIQGFRDAAAKATSGTESANSDDEGPGDLQR